MNGQKKRSISREAFENKEINFDFIGKKSYSIQQSRKRFMDQFPIEMEP